MSARGDLQAAAWLLALSAGACQPPGAPYPDQPSTLLVTLGPGTRTGCPGAGPPLPFESDLQFRVEAFDALGEPFPYTGPVRFRMAPGRLRDGVRQEFMTAGVLARVALSVRLSYGGQAHVWAELVGEGGAQATGVSPDLCFATPTVADVQRADSSHKTAFDGELVTFRGGRLVATGVDSRGFFVSDADAPEHGSIYVFTFRNPTGVKVGSCLCEVSGGIKEFLHFTEVVFPTWRVFKRGGRAAAAVELEEERIRVGDDEVPDPREDESILFEECAAGRSDVAACALADPFERERLTVPRPVRIDASRLPDVGAPPWDDAMVDLDRYEAALVAIGPVTMPDHFEAGCDRDGDGSAERCFSDCTPDQLAEHQCIEDCARRPGCVERTGYLEYGQWAVTAGGPGGDRRINLLTRSGLPDLEPVRDRPGGTVHCIVGNLRQVAAAPVPWVIQPRRPADVLFDPPPPGAPDPCAEP